MKANVVIELLAWWLAASAAARGSQIVTQIYAMS